MLVAGRVYENRGNPALLRLVSRGAGYALDCGCGAGDNARLLRAAGWTVDGVTISVGEQLAASQHCRAVYLGNLERGLPSAVNQNYDLILMSHVLEHLSQPSILLDDARRLLHPDGVLAVALPNAVHYRQRLQFLMGRFEYSYGGLMDETHLRFYTYATGARLLESAGFAIITSRGDGNVPYIDRLGRLLPHGGRTAAGLTNRLACRLLPGVFSWQCLYLARARSSTTGASWPRREVRRY